MGNCVRIAAALGRSLLLPRPVAELMRGRACSSKWCHLDRAAGESAPSGGGLGGIVRALASTTRSAHEPPQTAAFERLWDLRRFEACAVQRYGVALAPDALRQRLVRSQRATAC